ncbi:MAG: DUF5676 family membrane protein [Pseudobdellovibrio sp.]
MNNEKPLTTSIAAGSAVALIYTLIAIVFAVMPDFMESMIRSLNHGLNLEPPGISSITYTFGRFIVGLVYAVILSMIAGYVYGALRNVYQKFESGQSVTIRTSSQART